MAKKSAKLWIKNGALKYMDSIGSDVKKGKITSLPKSVKLKPVNLWPLDVRRFVRSNTEIK
jgi:uncharacterized protein YbaA (DUF1428 family)